MEHIPGNTSVSIFQKKSFIEAFASIPPIVAAGITVAINFPDPDKHLITGIAFGGMVWLILASIFRVVHAHKQDKKEAQQTSYEGLQGALYVLYSNVFKHLEYDDNDSERLRVTIHRVAYDDGKEGPTGLEQMLPYVGGKGGGEGRKFDIYPGIIGYVARNRTLRVASRVGEDHPAFVGSLMTDWFYTEEQAKSVSADRKAWMAVPILNKESKVLAVVYLDSTEREAFNEPVIDLVIYGCMGIAAYISKRYPLQAVSAKLAKPASKSNIQRVVEVSENGASLKQQEVVLTGEAKRELTSTATTLAGNSETPNS